ncbi:hypothetical protein [Ktedonosporobacter rubrisoli]|uniref:hypothetical protein n=1 Tax=Ktedonosporobacter rubrisoli TaxID=2509675 RepID=UPI001A9387A8|nr:hypothetical protein [Ktedonosporobacter rubrisoli]
MVGGALAGAWQWIFWLNVPIGLLLIALVLLRIPESFGPRALLDIVGLLLVTGASLGLVCGNLACWSGFEVVATLVAGVLLVVAFVFWELLLVFCCPAGMRRSSGESPAQVFQSREHEASSQSKHATSL